MNKLGLVVALLICSALALEAGAFATPVNGRKPVVRVVGNPPRAEVIATPKTTISGHRIEISTSIDLGQAVLTKNRQKVEGAPSDLTFSNVQWPKVDASGLPGGATLVSIARAGQESLPGLSITFAVPSSATSFKADVLPVSAEPITAHFMPAPFTASDSAVYRYSPNYASTIAHPSWGRPRTFRSLRSVTVWIPLVTSRGASRTLITKFDVRVECQFNGSLATGLVSDPVFAGLNNLLVLNSADLSRFAIPLRAPVVQRTGKNGIQTYDPFFVSLDTNSFRWIDPQATYVKLTVVRDGLYKIAASAISSRAAGFDLAAAGWNAHNVRLIHNGIDVPILVDSDAVGNITAITFYGERTRAVNEYYNDYTDSSAYFLTASTTGKHLRYREVKPAGPGSEVTSGDVLLHHERDLFYYLGDKVTDEPSTDQRTERVSGERFYWYDFRSPHLDASHPTDTARLFDTFYVAGLPSETAGKTAKFHFFIRGESVDPDPALTNDPTHHVKIRLNGEDIAEEFFKDYDSLGLEPQVALSKLHTGANVVEVLSAGTRATVDFFYLDYYEVRYEGAIAPSIDTAIARGQYDFRVTDQAGVRTFSSFPAGTHILNLTDTTVLSASHTDSSRALSHYVAASDAQMIDVAAVAKVTSWGLLDRGNQADYIIITHPNFRHAAEMLKIRRSTAGLRSMVVDVQDIFNAFGYGINDPEALRRFINYAYYGYAGVPASLVTLLGDASWDPKYNLSNEYWNGSDKSNQQSFIPSFGYPVSDFYFTLDKTGTLDTLQPLMMIARIPVSTGQEADSYVSKLVEYESQAPAEWNHNFLFLAGGEYGAQHEEFVNESQQYGADLAGPPTNVRTQIIERTDFSTQLDASHVSDIQSAVRDGRSLFYFAGHGATFASDMLLGDAKLWRNKPFYPVLLTLTCRTGAFAEPNQVSLNESFMRANDGGVIMSYGTTGFGEIYYDNVLSTELFALMKGYRRWHDTTRATMMNLTQIFTAAKLFASDTFGGFGFVNLNSRLQYAILGDAALGFSLRPQPEFVERSGDVTALNALGQPTSTVRVTDTLMHISAVVHNVGFSAEGPVVVRIRDKGPTGIFYDVLDTLPRLDTTATVTAIFPLTTQSVGNHTITVSIDPFNSYPETHEEDNESTASVFVSGVSVTAFYPYEGAIGLCGVAQGSVRVVLIAPRSDAPATAGKIEMQVDTTIAFTHPFESDTAFNGEQYVYRTLSLATLPSPTSKVYWWRARLVPTVGSPTDWQTSSFSVAPTGEQGFSYTSPEQLQQTIVSGLSLNAAGALYLPEKDSVRYDIVSISLWDSILLRTRSVVYINDRPVYEVPSFGYALAELTPDGASIDTVYEFNVSYDSAYDVGLITTFDSIVALIPNGRRVILLNYGQSAMPYFSFDDSVQAAFNSLGAAQRVRDINYFDSYILFGMKGAAPGTAKEVRTAGGLGPSELRDTIVTLGTSGIVETPTTAAALKFHTLSWDGPPLPAATDIQFKVLGISRSSKQEVIRTFEASSGRSFDLNSVDPYQYERLSVRATLVRGSSSDQSPELTGIHLSYDPAPELAFESDSIAVVPSSVLEAVPVVASYRVRILTCTPADNVPLVLVNSNNGSADTVHHLIGHLEGESSMGFADTIQTLGRQGTNTLIAAVNPNGAVNEQLLFNNEIRGLYRVGRDTSKPVSDILVDDRHLPPYGFAANDPWITIRLNSPSAIRQTDSLAITARFLREDSAAGFVMISAANPGDFRVAFESSTAGTTQAVLRFQPLHPLSPGRYQVSAYAHDANGNIADTLNQTFTVSAENGIEHVMNYPNPFKGETDFTYVLRNDARANVKIVVYTVAGRKLRTLVPAATHAGLNILHWDGRDEEGNVLANGTYLYRVVLASTDAAGKDITQGVTEKAVLAR